MIKANKQETILVTAEEVGGHVNVLIAGELNSYTSPRLEEDLHDVLAESHTRLALNMEHVTLLTSAGLRVILMVAKKLSGGGKLVLYECQPHVIQVLKITGFDSILTLCADYEQAIIALGESLPASSPGKHKHALLH